MTGRFTITVTSDETDDGLAAIANAIARILPGETVSARRVEGEASFAIDIDVEDGSLREAHVSKFKSARCTVCGEYVEDCLGISW